MTLEERLRELDEELAQRVGYQVYVEYELEGDTYEDGEQIRWCDTFPVVGVAEARMQAHQRILDHVREKMRLVGAQDDDDDRERLQHLQVTVYWYHPRNGHEKVACIAASDKNMPPIPTCPTCGAKKPRKRSE